MTGNAFPVIEAACRHPRIVTYCIAAEGPDYGQPAGLWACEVCRHKFVPLELAPPEWREFIAAAQAPETAESVQASAIAEHASRRIPGER